MSELVRLGNIIPASTIAIPIKEWRELLGLSQENLARLADVDIRTLGDLERGVANPLLPNHTQLADVLGLELCLHIK